MIFLLLLQFHKIILLLRNNVLIILWLFFKSVPSEFKKKQMLIIQLNDFFKLYCFYIKHSDMGCQYSDTEIHTLDPISFIFFHRSVNAHTGACVHVHACVWVLRVRTRTHTEM